MYPHEIAAAGLLLVSAAVSAVLWRVNLKLRRQLMEPERLASHARNGIAYAERIGGTNEQKLRHAIGASILSDKGVNGRQDWTDAQHRVAVEAELHRGSP